MRPINNPPHEVRTFRDMYWIFFVGNTMLTHWTKKIIVEDGHTGSQASLQCHILNK